MSKAIAARVLPVADMNETEREHADGLKALAELCAVFGLSLGLPNFLVILWDDAPGDGEHTILDATNAPSAEAAVIATDVAANLRAVAKAKAAEEVRRAEEAEAEEARRLAAEAVEEAEGVEGDKTFLAAT
jgi:hypothetical protein